MKVSKIKQKPVSCANCHKHQVFQWTKSPMGSYLCSKECYDSYYNGVIKATPEKIVFMPRNIGELLHLVTNNSKIHLLVLLYERKGMVGGSFKQKVAKTLELLAKEKESIRFVSIDQMISDFQRDFGYKYFRKGIISLL